MTNDDRIRCVSCGDPIEVGQTVARGTAYDPDVDDYVYGTIHMSCVESER